MSVELEPAELGFKRPFTQEVSQVLRLHNPNSDPVAFKVKTTAPKQYCVRPNSGRIEPGSDVEVSVLLQAMKEDPPLDARCRDKFLVQSVSVPAEKAAEFATVSQIWSAIESSAKGSIQEKKIRVTFLPADGQAATNGMSQSHHDDDHQLPAYSSPSPAAVTPQRSAGGSGIGAGALAAIGHSPSDQPYNPSSRSVGADSSYSNPAMSSSTSDNTYSSNNNNSTTGSAGAAVSSMTGMSQSDLQRQLDTANQKIQDLQNQAAEGLRKRNITGGELKPGEKSAMDTLKSQPAPGGVPIVYVALIALMCFLLAYFFF